MASTLNPYKKNYVKRQRNAINTRSERKIAKVCKQVIQQHEAQEVEKKYHDLAAAPGGAGSTGVFYSFTSTIPEGTGSEQRIGQQVTVKSLQVRYRLLYQDTTNLMRVIIFRWFQQGTPSLSQILQDTVTVPWISPTNRLLSEFINVMYDNLVTLDATNNFQYVDKIFIKKNMNVTFDDAGNPDYGHVYMLVLSDSAAIPHPTIEFYSRVRFTDQ